MILLVLFALTITLMINYFLAEVFAFIPKVIIDDSFGLIGWVGYVAIAGFLLWCFAEE